MDLHRPRSIPRGSQGLRARHENDLCRGSRPYQTGGHHRLSAYIVRQSRAASGKRHSRIRAWDQHGANSSTPDGARRVRHSRAASSEPLSRIARWRQHRACSSTTKGARRFSSCRAASSERLSRGKPAAQAQSPFFHKESRQPPKLELLIGQARFSHAKMHLSGAFYKSRVPTRLFLAYYGSQAT